MNKDKFDAQLNYLDRLIELNKVGVNQLGPHDLITERISSVINAIELTLTEK